MLANIAKSVFLASSCKVTLPQYFVHNLDPQVLPKETTLTRDEVLYHYREVVTMRKMEIKCDNLYKDKKIRGFCHLYSGQEAIAEGMQASLTKQDALIGAYRIHCQAYKRGYSVRQIISEMLGKGNGATKGKGGSMHYYKKSTNFYGGNGIVGAQIPVGVGLAFGLKYQKKKNVSAILFGDGAANQGQLFQAANMAKLWNLPALFVCENNIYGMGTSIQRSSMNPNFYTRGDRIPGIRADGNDLLHVRETTRWAKQYALQKGPIFLEFMTYRYHGHSMSDPGTTYRTRQQVQQSRKIKDPILRLAQVAVKNGLVTEPQLQAIDEEVEEHIQKQADLAQQDPQVEMSSLTDHVYVDNHKHFIRGKLYEESVFPEGQRY